MNFVENMMRCKLRRTTVSVLSILIMMALALSDPIFGDSVNAASSVIRVPDDYESIQAAVNAANPGDMIVVASGTYFEHIVINKTLALAGESKETTIIDGNGIGMVVEITARDVNFTGFSVKRSGQGSWTDCGILLGFGSTNNRISDNIVTENYHGVFLDSSDSNILSFNNISANTGRGVNLEFSSGNVISENLILRNEQDNGIELFESSNNVISANIVSMSGWGAIYLRKSSGNTIAGNVFSNNTVVGAYLDASPSSIFYRNNFIDNGLNEQGQLYSSASPSTWDNGAEGNYWSDYVGQDLNGDGIGETNVPYSGVDSYPLIEPWASFRTYPIDGKTVTISSNSTIAKFDFNIASSQIGFNVTGAPKTLGFCNVTAPKELLRSNPQAETWTVTIGGVYTSFFLVENVTHDFLYFTYAHSTRMVRMTVVQFPNVPPRADFTYAPTDPIADETVNFYDASSDSDGTVTSWRWDFGDGGYSIEQNPSHIYVNADTYVVTLRVSDNRGAETSIFKAIRVGVARTTISIFYVNGQAVTIVSNSTVDNFAFNQSLEQMSFNITGPFEALGFCNVTVPKAIINASSPRIWTVAVDFSSLSFVLAENLTHTSLYFTYVENSGRILIRVESLPNTPPLADFAYQPSEPTIYDPVNFADLSTDDGIIVSWHWDFGDGNYSAEPSPSHLYVHAGFYVVTLTVQDDQGAEVSISKVVSVRWAKPSLNMFWINGHLITILSNSTISSFDFIESLAQMRFNVTGPSNTLGFCNVTVPKVLLKGENHTSIWVVTVNGTNVSFSAAENATYTSLYFSYVQGSGSVLVGVVVLPNLPPTADFIYSPVAPTPRVVVDFVDRSTDVDGSISSWRWDFGDDGSSNKQNPGHSYEVSGTYIVTLKVADNRGTETMTSKALKVLEVADVEPPVADAGEDQTAYVDVEVFFDASGSEDNVGIVSYKWDFGDGSRGTGMAINHTYNRPGEFTVTLTVVDLAGNSAADSVTVTILLAPGFPSWIIAAGLIAIAGVVVLVVYLRKRK